MSQLHAREENGDLFGYGDGHELLTQHLDQLELPDDPEYSGVMQSMLQVFKTVVHSHKGEADTLPMALLLNLCKEMGGIQVYLPRGRSLLKQIEDLQIWEQFSGRNVKELALRYRKSEATIYRSSPRTASGKANYGSLIYLVANYLNIRQNGGV